MLTQLPKYPFHMIGSGIREAHESCILDTIVFTGQPLAWVSLCRRPSPDVPHRLMCSKPPSIAVSHMRMQLL